MATSGSYGGNTVSYGNYMFVNWQVAGQEIGNNRTLINWQAYFRFNGSDSQLDNGGVWSNVGQLWGNGGRVYNFAGNYTTRNLGLASGSFWINHGSDGRGYIQLGVGITSGWGRSEGTSGVWELPTIPRASTPTLSANPVNIGSTVQIYMNRADASFTHTVVFAFGSWSRTLAGGVTNQYGYDTSVDASNLYAQIPSSNSGYGTITVYTYDGSGNLLGSNGVALYLNVVNSDPVFTTYTYRDSNSTTSTVTGNDQVLIQGQSTLEAKILATNKATAQNSATMVKYNASISSVNQDITYSTSDITQALGTIGTNTTTDLVMKAIDSRGNFVAVTKSILVLPYVIPQVTATARRVNNFETSTNFHIEGVISRLTLSGTDKNAVNTSTGVAYRVKKTSDVSWGSWTNKTSSTTTGNVSVTDFAVNLDRNYAWNVEVRITDKLNTSTLALLVPVGIPIFRIGLDGFVYNNEVEIATTTKVTAMTRIDNSSTEVATNEYDSDGYQIYKKTVTGTWSAGTNSSVAINHGISNMRKLVNHNVFINLSQSTISNSGQTASYRETGGNWANVVSISATTFSITTSFAWGTSAYRAVFWYTKN